MDKKIKLYFCCINSERWWQLKEVISNIYDYVDKVIIIYGGNGEDGTVNDLKSIAKKLLDGYTIWSYFDNGFNLIEGEVANKDRANLEDPSKEVNPESAKIHIVYKKWMDNFPNQRQKYLDMVSILRDDDEISWVIVSDTDEYFSPALIKGIRNLIEKLDDLNYDCMTIRSKGITLDEDNNVLNSTYDDWWKTLVFKFDPSRKIIGVTPEGKPANVHEGFSRPFVKVYKLPSREEQGLDRELVYEHRKYFYETWLRGSRNHYAGGGGPNYRDINPEWLEFRELVSRCAKEDGFGEINTSMDYEQYLRKGNIHKDLKKWFIDHLFEGIKDRDFNKYPLSKTEKFFMNYPKQMRIDYDGASEVREHAKIYFEYLHKDELLELPEELVMDSCFEQFTKDWYKENKNESNS